MADAHARALRLAEMIGMFNETGTLFSRKELGEIISHAKYLYNPAVAQLILVLCQQADKAQQPPPDIEIYRKVVAEYLKEISERHIEPDPEAAMAYIDSQAEYEAIKKASGL